MDRNQRMHHSLTALQWILGFVILIGAILFVMPGARQDFSRTHLPNFIRLILGWGEIIGALLLLIPATARRGAWTLIAIFLFAIAIHLLHGMPNVGNLVIYTSATWVVASAKSA